MKFIPSSLILGSAALALAACAGEAEETTEAVEAEVAETAEVEAPEGGAEETASEAAGAEVEEGTGNPIGPMSATEEE